MAGLKTLAKELQSKGRNGDTILAHINPQEAGILKALGGSGTRNPITGLPEFFGGLGALNPFNPGSASGKAIGQIPGVKQIQNVATKINQPLEKAIVKPVSKGLSEFDKQVARTVPGGWATIAQVAASMIPGGQPLAVAIGAAKGAGLTRTGSSLQRADLKGAVIGGATAYATSELGEYMRGASDTAAAGAPGAMSSADVIAQEGGSLIIPEATGSAVSESGVNAATGEFGSGLAGNTSGYLGSDMPVSDVLSNVSGYDVGAPLPAPQSIGSEIMKGNISNVANRGIANLENLGTSTIEGIQNLGTQAVELGNKVITPETYTEGIPNVLGKGYEGVSNTASGAKNLLGLGDISRSEAIKLAAKTGIDPIKMTGMVIYGETALAGLEERRKYLEEAKRANAISQAEYDQALASINSQRDYAQSVVNQSPFNPNPNRDVSIGETFYRRGDKNENLYASTPDSGSTLYAMGGQVDDELGGDYSAMGMDQGNMQKGLFGLGYAAGGMPQFLSGGGDGMSDSIKASINGTQEARLADGEFVIPADVVSHLGNGSSKAGAKQLYSMMDKIRKARTGRKSQGKQINPRKYLPA